MGGIVCKLCLCIPREHGQYCTDCQVLVDAAIRALSIARQEGVVRYGPSTWVKAPDNLDRACTHIYKFRRNDTSEDQLSHAITRLVMEYAVTSDG